MQTFLIIQRINTPRMLRTCRTSTTLRIDHLVLQLRVSREELRMLQLVLHFKTKSLMQMPCPKLTLQIELERCQQLILLQPPRNQLLYHSGRMVKLRN